MNKLVICTYCDVARGMLEEYREQLHCAGIAAFHVETIKPFPHPSGLPVSFKFSWMREFALRFVGEFERLVFTDAYDVLFVSSSDIADRIPAEVTWAAERNCYPEPELAEKIIGETPWRYVNAGLMSGAPQAIIDWVDGAQRHPAYEPELLDQRWLNRRLADTPGMVKIDSGTANFYVVSSTLERGELQMRNGLPWNSLCNSTPSFFHFSGQCPTESFRELLAGRALELG
jgi:hypothetical protein